MGKKRIRPATHQDGAKAEKAARRGKLEVKDITAEAGEPGYGQRKTPVEPATPPAKKKAAKAKPAADKPKRLSALDAAALVLGAQGEPMSAKAMIEAMAAQKLWTSPGGKTPEATLYAAIVREIAKKGAASRFVKTDRGLFTHHPSDEVKS